MGKKRNTNKVTLALPTVLTSKGAKYNIFRLKKLAITTIANSTLAFDTFTKFSGGGAGSVCGRERTDLLSELDELESVHSSLTEADFGDSGF